MTGSPYPTTPCIAVCTIDPKSSLCMGCYRTLKEIARWDKMTEAERKSMQPVLDERRAADLAALAAKREARDAAGG
jgi:predicted Fe-S protein YdhL (DUF1289 family)